MDEELNVVNATTEEVVTPQQTEQANQSTESVNEEVTTSQQTEKPVQSADENSKYASIRREYEAKIATETATAEQKGRDSWIASQGYIWNDKPITTEAEYNQAILEKSYQDKGIDINLINEAVQNNPTVKKAQETLTKQEKEAAKQADYMDFLSVYKDVKPEEITKEVWESVNQGIPLRIAYAAEQENAILKAQLEEFKKGAKTLDVNNKNALTSTGSTTGNGSLPSDFISKETFEVNKKNSEWMSKNYDLLKNSMNKW